MAEREPSTSPSPSSREEESGTGSSSEDNRSGSPSRVSTPRSSSPPKRSRKRIRRSNAWKKNVRKQCRNAGQRYVSDTTDRTVTPKRASRVSCHCARRCFEKVSEVTRKELFDGFWKTANFDVQNAFLCGCVKVFATKRKGVKSPSRRQFSRIYYVQNGPVSVRVCKTAFLAIFGISNGRLERALSSQAEEGGVPHQDQRGRHVPANKTPQEKIEQIKEHIAKFPCYQSHYSRCDNPNRKYLSPDLSISKMYALYKDHCSEQEVEAVSGWKYRHVFNTTFNLTFGRPKSDTCKTCDALNARISAASQESEKSLLESELHLHHCKAERAYHQLQEDTALCRTSANIDMFTFDLEQALPTPKLTTNIVFYKRQMWTYNLGVHDCSNGKGYMYMWPETTASRGSQEIGSCLLQHFKFARSQAQNLIAFSDACGGQNRNINIVCFWMYVVGSSDFSYATVDHKFMLSGHSYLPNDRDFETIEKASRHTQHVYVPEDWCVLVERARQRNPFTVKQMATSDFVSIENVRSLIVYRKTNTQKQKVEWLNIRWLQISADHPFQVRYRYSLNSLEAWKTLDLRKRRVGRPADVGRVVLEPLYSGPRPLSEKKLADLRVLTEFIPPIHHAYYRSLEATNDPIGSSSESEEEEESH